MDSSSETPAPGGHSLLEMSGIEKSFPGVRALRAASFALRAGEIHALVGENGAGKSTLIKILTGVHRRDGGEIRLLGQPAEFRRPLEAQRAGIATIYQEFTLVPSLSVAANIFLGHEAARRGLIDHGRERRAAAALLDRLGAALDPSALVSGLTVAQQQIVEVARALAREARILVMDEPTAALAPHEVAHLFAILRDLAGRGMGIVFISHRLDEVAAIADRITVMRDGATIAVRRAGEFSRAELIELMVGRPLDQEYPKAPAPIGPVHFEVRGLSGGFIEDVSFAVRRGEVLGLAGLMGAGRTEVARLIFGADRKRRGEIRLGGRPLEIASPRAAIGAGVCLLTEDRRRQGLVLGASARDNFALPNLGSWSRLAWIDRRREQERFAERTAGLNIRLSHPEQRAEELSGGNQQKLLVARWLETNSEVVIFDEPTRGIDVGAKYEMYVLIGRLTALGKCVIVISSELPELLGICDRILVLRRGRVAGEVAEAARATQEDLMALAV
ncbi:MAG TPA: sugar ABC transporter ATP-binding protein [candidate division Zixibacteria bacterium]|nr:sugar ABC transporter ATP-binding protein [candidate division Zixibacteria bacterium]HOD65123.1 sugar ABC transporter ATP-binding protein [candidate division Zixibacteria bacterium]HPC11126.1 sugar ABC transporter ATP-binding protein [candidate division Zixibacteria bacterium]HPM37757.1 sugar ABC transporter ATP-binding protein [candidate division Zixibacteria bacterium]